LEMFPVLIYLPYVLALYLCLNFATQSISSNSIVFDVQGIVGMVTAFFMMLQMRTFDDLKDIEIDKDLFPERATPRGAVLKKDIQIISIVAFCILVVTNFVFGQKTILVFIIMMLYALLTFKWFFAEKYHREHVFFTMLTHQPLPIMINFFLIHTALASGNDYEQFNTSHFILLLIFSLPITAWETSRKIRSLDKEDEYETFSKLFGARGASIIPLTCLLLSGLLSIYIGFQLNLTNSHLAIVGILILMILFFFGRFLLQPSDKNNVLKNITMLFTTALFFNLLIHILLISTVSVKI
jgi:4-hydroxybenzoate polyprenyltransferase